jgi:F0F1-type ATP synthase epsilon subunit
VKELKLEILSPQKPIFSGPVASVIFPATYGLMGVLPGHAPLLALLTAGRITAHPVPQPQKPPPPGPPPPAPPTAHPVPPPQNPDPRSPTPGPRPLAFSISGGIAEVRPHSVTILADSASAAAD